MGANVSGTLYGTNGEEGPPLKPKLGDIPESCIALVLMHLDPAEICKLARLNRAFRSASSADFLWESKLPSNYGYILEKLLDDEEGLADLGKKDIYVKLCRHNFFDGGTKEVWVDKNAGGVCLSISSKALTITGIDDRRYWNRISTEESRFQTLAYLHQIWWFEVDGELEFRFPAGSYSVFFRLQLFKISKRMGHRVCNPEHIHGWDVKPVTFQVTTSDGGTGASHCFLDDPGNWVMYHAGDFKVQHPNQLMNIKFSMTQIDCTHTKGGLCVDGVFIHPSNNTTGSKGCKILHNSAAQKWPTLTWLSPSAALRVDFERLQASNE